MKLPHTDEVPDALFEAARVSRFMQEGSNGRWRLRTFTVTEDEYQRKVLTLHVNSEHPAEEIAREVPPGFYISLQRRMTEHERRQVFYDAFGHYPEDAVKEFEGRITADDLLHEAFDKHDTAWTPVMADTPAEIMEHDHALNNATGRVLITGLGLGCLPHALLTKPDVTHIDIVEIDAEVLGLTARYLNDPRVTIHHASALDIPMLFAPNERFDYVWHDIWSHVSSKNLDDETAEHGISYGRLERLCAEHLDVGQTDAWALPMALRMRGTHREEREREDAFVRDVRAMTDLDAAARLLADRVLWTMLSPRLLGATEFDPVPEGVRMMLDPDGHILAQARKRLDDAEFWTEWEERRASTHESDFLDSPNAHLEVARRED